MRSHSGVLILGSSSIQAVFSSTLVSQVELLLDSHRIEDAVYLADAQRTKLLGNIALNPDEAEELSHVYQRIGFQCFKETLFEEAGKNLLKGDIDPRLLISYYPDLCGSLFAADDTIEVFSGVADQMPMDSSVDNIIRNYSPHLAPNTRSAPPTVELRKVLHVAAKEMLQVFLSEWRTRFPDKISAGESALALGRGIGGPREEHSCINAVDTVLAKLYCELGKVSHLLSFLQEPNCVLLSEVESVLIAKRQYSVLCMMYKKWGDDLKLLEAWSKLIDGEWMDAEIEDPVSDMIALLTEKRDRVLIRQWGVWLMKRDPDRGLKLLMLKDPGKQQEMLEEDLELLEQIREASHMAEMQFLEYLVLQKRSTSRTLHTRLAKLCVEQLSAALDEDSVSNLWCAKASSYMSDSPHISFLSYFMSTTPHSNHRHLRLKTILCLAGSTLYDPTAIYPQLLVQQNSLKLEMAIIEGMLGNHYPALTILVHDLHDYMTAEAYCMLGGIVVSSKTAQLIAEKDSTLEPWVSALFGRVKSSKSVHHDQLLLDKELKKKLLRMLMGVYMNNRKANTHQVAHLLNSQTINFDFLDMINLVPLHWPVNLVSSFFSRSFEQMLHEQCEGRVMKAFNAGHNTVIKEQSWLELQQHGMVIEEAIDSDGNGEKSENCAYAEKVAVQCGLVSDMFSDSIQSTKEV